ncbi:MAG: DUF3443 family protein [Terriglobia bacterium]
MTLKDSSAAMLARLLVVMMGMLVIVGCGGSNASSTSTTTTTPATNNSTALTVNFGPNGQAGGYFNDITTTVTICQHGSTTNCQVVDKVLVDTGSVGLRILNSVFTTIQPSSLGVVQDSTDDQLQECIQYGDTSYSWGPMWLADVQVGGETASNVAIQVIGGNAGNATFANVPSQCLAVPVASGVPNGGNEDTVATFGANGVLGVGPYPQDCGSGCTDSSNLTTSGYPYYVCPTGQACSPTTVPVADQAVNPVAFFSSSDTNGVMITLGSVAASGAASATGTMYFGISTQTNNSLGSATVYALNDYETIDTVTYNGIAYTGGFNGFDTGSNALYVSDAATLGTTDCADDPGLYCPSSTLNLSNITLTGDGGVGSGTVSLSIVSADSLLNTNSGFAAFNDIAGDGGTSPSNDDFDFGLPFFLGKTIFVGIAGTTVPSGASAPNGWYGL